MPVPAAILAPAARGRDLWCRHTVSGKNIAFGAALAETLRGWVAGGGGDVQVLAPQHGD